METHSRQLMEAKGKDIFGIAPDKSVYDAINVMAGKGGGSPMVMENEKVVGVISEPDYSRKFVFAVRCSQETAVREIMTTRVVFGRPYWSISETMSSMTENRFRHTPVLDAGKVVGIVSIGDLVKVVIADQEVRIEQLGGDISG